MRQGTGYMCVGILRFGVCAPDECVCAVSVLAGTQHVQTLSIIEKLTTLKINKKFFTVGL